MKQSGSWHFYPSDGLGSTMAVVDASGVVQDSYTYDVYGTPTRTGSLANEFDFAGQQTDGTGLQYLRARYYDPATGTFLSRDPMAVSPAWRESAVAYGAAAPTIRSDPTGRSITEEGVGQWGNPTPPASGQVYSCSPSGCGYDYIWYYGGGISCSAGVCSWNAWAITNGGKLVLGRCVSLGEYPHCSSIGVSLPGFLECLQDADCTFVLGQGLVVIGIVVAPPAGAAAITVAVGTEIFTITTWWLQR